MKFNDIVIICIFAFIGYLVVASIINTLQERKSSRAENNNGDGIRHDSAASNNDTNSSASPLKPRTLIWHEVLNIPESATLDQIKSAYKRLITQYHPDKVADMAKEIRDLAEVRSKEINAAYEHAIKLRGA